MMMRYATVRGLSCTTEKVAAYLPSNYRVLGQVGELVVIGGRDDHGWNMDGYVIPRLGSGLMRCDEIDLSHEVMKQIPIDA